MSDTLPQIVSEAPIVIPEQVIPETTYPDLYVVNLRVHTEQKDMSCQAEVRLQPYNYTTKQIMIDGPCQDFSIEDVWAESERVPLLATVMGGLIQVTALLIKEKKLTEEMKAGIDVSEELSAVQTALGITV